MPLSSDKRAGYEIVLRDEEQERDELLQQISGLQSRLKEVQGHISHVSRKLTEDTPSNNPLAQTPLVPRTNHRYALTSVRWAVLDLLSNSEPMTTAAVAEALKAAGVQTRATNFANNVSAVLSTTMRDKRSEVHQLDDGRWELTENGKNSIAYIRTTPKFRRALGW
jgi:hypothetical protein